MISILQILKFFQIAANAAFMSVSSVFLNSSEFAILNVIIFSVSSYSLIENVIFYSKKKNGVLFVGGFPVILAVVYFLYLLVQPVPYTSMHYALVLSYVCLRYFTSLHEHQKEDWGFGIKVNVFRMQASMLHLIVATVLFSLNILPVIFSYFIGGILSLLYVNFSIRNIKGVVAGFSPGHTGSLVFTVKILFSSLSGYLLNYYLLILVKDNDQHGFNSTAIAVSLFAALVAVLLSDAFANRAKKAEHGLVLEKSVLVSLGLLLVFAVLLYLLKKSMLAYESHLLFVSGLMRKLPDGDVIFATALVFSLQFLCSYLAIGVRSHRTEPVFIANILIVVCVMASLFLKDAYTLKSYFVIQLIINTIALVEIYLSSKRLAFAK